MSAEKVPLVKSDSIDPKSGLPMYRVCDYCNYEKHMCHFCGETLTHSDHDFSGNHHTAEYCRPDLFPHEPGDTCTWPVSATRSPSEAGCYFDHSKESSE